MSLHSVDNRHGLLPWLYPDHLSFFRSEYDSKKSNPSEQSRYLDEYVKAEEKDDVAYKAQQDNIFQAQEDQRILPEHRSQLPNREKLDWNPEKEKNEEEEKKPKRKTRKKSNKKSK